MDLQPAHDLLFDRCPSKGTDSLIFTGDGRLYAQSYRDSLNLWKLIIFYWPEVLGTALFLVLIVVACVLVKIYRHPRTPGAPYCRRCRYDLSVRSPTADALNVERIQSNTDLSSVNACETE